MSNLGDSLDIPLNGLAFKGDRTYLQGPDVLLAVLDELHARRPRSNITDIDIVFHHVSTMGLTLVNALPSGSSPSVVMSCRIDGLKEKLFLVSDGRPVVERKEYYEEAIVEATEITPENSTISLRNPLPFSNIECWVAMVKRLHHILYPNLEGKWLFVRGKFNSYLERDEQLNQVHTIRLESNFNNKLTRSAVLVNELKVGDIFFSIT